MIDTRRQDEALVLTQGLVDRLGGIRRLRDKELIDRERDPGRRTLSPGSPDRVSLRGGTKTW